MAIKKGFKALLAEANAAIKTMNVEEARRHHGAEQVVFVDLRDPRELEREGLVPGSFHATRGMLEFWIDPESPYHKQIFAEDRTFIFYCAGGWRSALAAKTAVDMGLDKVAHIEGGFGAWKKAGAPVEMREPRVHTAPVAAKPAKKVAMKTPGKKKPVKKLPAKKKTKAKKKSKR